MAFKVWLDGDDVPVECGDGDVYEFLTSGVLAVHYTTPGRWADYYPSGRWRRLTAAPNHRAGEQADNSFGPAFD